MKRDLSILSNLDWEGVERWLDFSNVEKGYFCPFSQDHWKCEMLFPGTLFEGEDVLNECPCSRLDLEEVTAVVEEILAEMKAAQE